MPTGIYLSRCAGCIDSAIDLDDVRAHLNDRASVVRVVDDLFDPASVELMVADAAAGIDAIVLAGNSAEHYSHSVSGHLLPDRLVEAGINRNRIVAANILEQVALAHPGDVPGATRKAKAVIDVALLAAQGQQPMEAHSVKPRHSVLVLGVCTEGVIAAQRLLRLGYSVVLADREKATQLDSSSRSVLATNSFVTGHPASTLVEEARLADAHGWLGDYRVTLATPAGAATFDVGGILLARPDQGGWVDELRARFRVDVDEAGNARSLDETTHPAETIEPGITIIPQRVAEPVLRDSVAAADAAAMALVLKLQAHSITEYREVSEVDRELCGGCATCVRTCAFGACSLDAEGQSVVDERRCRSCGKCVVSCPVGARDIVNAPHDVLLEAVRTLSKTRFDGPKVLGFLCGGCGYPAADDAARAIASGVGAYPSSFLPVRIPCGGRLDTLYVLEAFRTGFDAVCVYRCREGHCHNLIGNLDMDRRINLLRTVLRSRGIDDARLRIVDIASGDGERFIESVEAVYQTIGSLNEMGVTS